jgi:alpha-tubulin suppressor-like RCC1 family protein
LGNGEEEDWYAPTGVEKTGGSFFPLTGVAAISAGDGYTCARMSDSTARCWGANLNGELGIGTRVRWPWPMVVKNAAGTGALHNVAGIQTGTGWDAHTCARMSDGTARCWGNNDHGELGDGTTGTDRLLPVGVKNNAGTGALRNVRAISTGDAYTCAAISDGTARCWGSNYWGQLGDGTAGTDRLLPVTVKNVAGTGPLPKVTAISAGNSHSCARVSYAQARCWGGNGVGQLGDGTTGVDRLLPVKVG